MRLKAIIIAIALLATTMPARSSKFNLRDSVHYSVKVGYNIGATTPIGIPATIRKMNSYTPHISLSLGVDMHKQLSDKWGIMSGLRIENKDMEVDATVKNYHMEIVQGGKRLKGYYTGNTVIKVEEWMLTLPILATYSIKKNVIVKLGPYVSYVQGRKFYGYVYDGYLRENTPTGARIDMGNTEDTRATFDFSSDMNRVQCGIDAGVDWYFNNRWGAFADLTWGITGVFKGSFQTIEQKLYPIFGTIGVTYKLK